MALTLCPPAIAEGADMNLMTRLQVARERRAYWQTSRFGLTVPLDFLDELDSLSSRAIG